MLPKFALFRTILSDHCKKRLAQLDTERRNQRTSDLNDLATKDLVRVLHEENHLVAGSIDPVLPRLAELVDEIVKRLQSGGRIIYVAIFEIDDNSRFKFG